MLAENYADIFEFNSKDNDSVYINFYSGADNSGECEFYNIMLCEDDTSFDPYYEPKNYSIDLSNNYLARVNDVKDELWIKPNGGYGKTERIKHIASYNGETITTDYISSTGALTTGAEIYYVAENKEEKLIGILTEPIKLWDGTNIFELESNIPTDFEINYYKT